LTAGISCRWSVLAFWRARMRARVNWTTPDPSIGAVADPRRRSAGPTQIDRSGSLRVSSRAEDAELVALRVGENDP
jgi:hypothetical protein